MSRSPEQAAAGIAMLRPPGWANPTDPDSYTAAHDSAAAHEMAALEASIEAMLPEIDLREAFNLLRDYERVLGPDPCGRDLLALTEAERRGLAFQRWTAAPTVSAGYFAGLAAALGIPLTITEYPLSATGWAVCGDELIPSPRHVEFKVSLTATNAWDAICGQATCDEPLGGFTSNLMECVVARESPLHARPHFDFSGA